MTSYVDEHGEWENRKISIVGALQSFITQLSIGDDLTKISLPSVLLNPYSALELGCSKGLGHVYFLLKANQETDPIQRLLGIVRWYLTYTQQEKIGKKPYNPIIAETLLGWVDLSQDKEFPFKGVTKFFAEQVSHHPPATAYFIENAEQNVRMQTTVEFSTSFHGNSVTAKPVGPAFIEMNNQKYVINKTMPDMMIRNVILGTRRHAWEGEVTIICQETGLKAQLNYYEEGWYCVNTVNGFISNVEDSNKKLYTFYGPLANTINLTNVATNKVEPFINLGGIRKLKINYLPLGRQDQTSSIKVWKELSEAIVKDDMYAADIAKRNVEGAQRKRRNEGTSFAPRYFAEQSPGFWAFDFENRIKELDAQIETANDPLPETTETTDSNEQNTQ